MTCIAITWQQARIKSKISVAQTASQAAVYAKGLIYYSTLWVLLYETAYSVWSILLPQVGNGWIVSRSPFWYQQTVTFLMTA
jgi:lipocalin